MGNEIQFHENIYIEALLFQIIVKYISMFNVTTNIINNETEPLFS